MIYFVTITEKGNDIGGKKERALRERKPPMPRPWGRSRCIQRRSGGQVPEEREGGEWDRGSAGKVCVWPRAPG